MHKDNLKGEFVTFFDEDSKQRTEKVVKINGNTLTVVNKVGRRKRINPSWRKIATTNKKKFLKPRFTILGRQLKNKIEQIEWN